jgi:hypothetical protein
LSTATDHARSMVLHLRKWQMDIFVFKNVFVTSVALKLLLYTVV